MGFKVKPFETCINEGRNASGGEIQKSIYRPFDEKVKGLGAIKEGKTIGVLVGQVLTYGTIPYPRGWRRLRRYLGVSQGAYTSIFSSIPRLMSSTRCLSRGQLGRAP